jgi:HJR/Mrr/RecB family endonuclease
LFGIDNSYLVGNTSLNEPRLIRFDNNHHNNHRQQFAPTILNMGTMKIEQDVFLSHLREIDEYDFEVFVAKLWERYGWKTTVTSGSNDRGVDVISGKDTPFKQNHAIQVKRWGSGNKVGRPQIQQYSSLRHRENDIDFVVVVTTSSFTRQAKEEASNLDVKLVDGSDLYQVVSEVDAEDLVSDYIDLRESDSDISNSSIDLENTSSIDLISNNLEEEVHKYRTEASGSKYDIRDPLKLAFRDEDGGTVEVFLQYSAVYPNGSDLSIKVVGSEDVPEQVVDEIGAIQGIDHVWMEESGKIAVSSSQGSSDPECRALSILIDRYYPGFSKDDRLYIGERVPKLETNSTEKSSNVVDGDSNDCNSLEEDMDLNSSNQTNSTSAKYDFELERDFEDSR